MFRLCAAKRCALNALSGPTAESYRQKKQAPKGDNLACRWGRPVGAAGRAGMERRLRPVAVPFATTQDRGDRKQR